MCIAVIRYACGAVEHGSDLRPGDVRTCGCNEQKVYFITRDENCTHCTFAHVELPPTTPIAKAKALGLVPADTPEPPRRPDSDDEAERTALRMIQKGSSASMNHSEDQHASPLADSPPVSPGKKITMHDNEDSATAIATPTEARPSDPARRFLSAPPASYTYSSPTTQLSADNVMKHTTEQPHPSSGGFESLLSLNKYGAERRDTTGEFAAEKEQSTIQPRKSGVANDIVDRSVTTTVTGVSGNTGVSRTSGSIFFRGEGESTNETSPSSALAGSTVRHVPMADSQWGYRQQHPLENLDGSSVVGNTAAPMSVNTGNPAGAPANTDTMAPMDTATYTPVNTTAKTTPAPANPAQTATTTDTPLTTFAHDPANTANNPTNTTANTIDTRSRKERRKERREQRRTDKKAAERAAAAGL